MAGVVVNGAGIAVRARQGEAYWREQIAAWKGSGLSQLEFCKDRGLSRFGFGKWKVRLEGAGPAEERGSCAWGPRRSESGRREGSG
jgi:hypothetical protein